MSARAESGHLAESVVRFAQLLRRAGLPVGVDKTLAAVEAAAWVGPERRADLHAALAATLTDRPEQRMLFDEAFRLFWRAAPPAAALSQLPRIGGPLARRAAPVRMPNRLAEALGAGRARAPEPTEPILLDAALTRSEREVLRQRDFETMTAEEAAAVRRLLRNLELPLPPRRSRRFRPHPAGRSLDLRATLRLGLKHGGEWLVCRRRARRETPRELVVLCDISGSMARYARMLLHFLHGLGSVRRGLHVFVFGTRLTIITRALRARDVDQALAAVSRAVPDWSGGTRIGACLREFNRRWSRRVLARGAVVMLISDGLDAGPTGDLEAQIERLRASCAALLWLNPLLRFSGFEPRAAGVRAMLPYVDYFLPAHNLASLEDLARVLRTLPAAGRHRNRRTMETTRWK